MTGAAAGGGRPRIVVAGYGNPLRGDDGAGWRVACALRERYAGRPDVAVLAGQQPVPEWAAVLAGASVAYLVDAGPESAVKADGGGGAVGLRLTRLTDGTCRPPPAGTGATTASTLDGHAVGPAALLALCRAAYGRVPETFLLTIPAERLGFADRLSASTAAAAEEAIRLLAGLVEEGRTPAAEVDECA
jgi:Ni,Fe-hydrogenase maturation factor